MGDPVRSFLMGAHRPAGIGKTVHSDGPGRSNYYTSPWYQPGSVGTHVPAHLSTTSADAAMHSFEPLSSIRSTMHSFPMQNSVVDTMGLNTNWFVPYARKAGRFATSTFEDFVTGQIIFLNKDKNKPLARRTAQSDISVDWMGARPPRLIDGVRSASPADDIYYAKHLPLGCRYALFTLQRLNWTFALTELRPDDAEEWMMDAETRMSTWSLDGAVRNEEGGDTPRGINPDPTNEKVLNITVSGHAFVHNLWGNEIQPQTNLWFIAKRFPRKQLPNEYVLNAKGHALKTSINKAELKRIFGPGRIPLQAGEDKGGWDQNERDSTNLLTDYPFQVVPWASTMHSRPPPSEMIYKDDFGDTAYGKAIYFGKVEGTPTYTNGSRFGSVSHNTIAAISAPKMWVFVDPKPDS